MHIHIVLIFHCRLRFNNELWYGSQSIFSGSYVSIRKWSATKTKSFWVNRFIWENFKSYFALDQGGINLCLILICYILHPFV